MKSLPPPDPLLKQEGETTGTDESPLLDKEGLGVVGFVPTLFVTSY